MCKLHQNLQRWGSDTSSTYFQDPQMILITDKAKSQRPPLQFAFTASNNIILRAS